MLQATGGQFIRGMAGDDLPCVVTHLGPDLALKILLDVLTNHITFNKVCDSYLKLGDFFSLCGSVKAFNVTTVRCIENMMIISFAG